MGVPSGTAVRAAGLRAGSASPRATDMGIGMLCQYSRQRPVSSEKHETAAEAGAEEG
jgi:hypothetical protein